MWTARNKAGFFNPIQYYCLAAWYFLAVVFVPAASFADFDYRDLKKEKSEQQIFTHEDTKGSAREVPENKSNATLDIKIENYDKAMKRSFVVFGQIQNDRIILFNKTYFIVLNSQGKESTGPKNLPLATSPMNAHFTMSVDELKSCEQLHRFDGFVSEIQAIRDYVGKVVISASKKNRACAEKLQTKLIKWSSVELREVLDDIAPIRLDAPIYLEPIHSVVSAKDPTTAPEAVTQQKLTIDGSQVKPSTDGYFVKSLAKKFPVSLDYESPLGRFHLQMDPILVSEGRNNIAVDYAQFVNIEIASVDSAHLTPIPPPPPLKMLLGLDLRGILLYSSALPGKQTSLVQPLGFAASFEHPLQLVSYLKGTLPYGSAFSSINAQVLEVDYSLRYFLDPKELDFARYVAGGLYLYQLTANSVTSNQVGATPALTNYFDYYLGFGISKKIGSSIISRLEYDLSPLGVQTGSSVTVQISQMAKLSFSFPYKEKHVFNFYADIRQLTAPLTTGQTTMQLIEPGMNYFWKF